MTKYKIIVGLPSGEVMNVPQKGINMLRSNGLVWKEVLFDGEANIVYYVYDDSLMDDVVDVLSDLSGSDW